MNVEKTEFILRFVESEIPNEIDNVLNDSETDPHFSAVYTSNLIESRVGLLSEIGKNDLSYTDVKSCFEYFDYTESDYIRFEEKWKLNITLVHSFD